MPDNNVRPISPDKQPKQAREHGWRALALYSWQADHLIDEEMGDPTDEWHEAITHTNVHETNEHAAKIASLKGRMRQIGHGR